MYHLSSRNDWFQGFIPFYILAEATFLTVLLLHSSVSLKTQSHTCLFEDISMWAKLLTAYNAASAASETKPNEIWSMLVNSQYIKRFIFI